MLLKQTALALSSTTCSVNCPSLSSSITSSWHGLARPTNRHAASRIAKAKSPRSYATVTPGGSRRASSQPSGMNDLPKWPTTANPTPYEIFGQTKGAPYSKVRFYKLVKLYHPDRHHHTEHDGISRITKLDRYRLVVAANEILSDPAKRYQYDMFGFGWAEETDTQSLYRAADKAWRKEPGNASTNATWEDWERWYQERDGKKSEPRYMSNLGFVGVIVCFVLIGGWGQSIRAGAYSANLVEMQQRKSEAIHREMRWREAESARLTREGRIESFMKQREGWDDVKHARSTLMPPEGST